MDDPEPTDPPTVAPGTLCEYCGEPVGNHPQIVAPDDEPRQQCFGVYRVE